MNRRNTAAKVFYGAAVLVVVLSAPLIAQQEQVTSPGSHTQIVLLGTGNPAADPDRSGPATAIIVNGTAYAAARIGREGQTAPLDRLSHWLN
jgi:hypothetical protein